MGQETDADTSCEANDYHNPMRMPTVYKTLAIGWILGAVVFLIITNTSFLLHLSCILSIFLHAPLPITFAAVILFLFIFLIQYKVVKELEIYNPSSTRLIGRIFSGAVLLSIIYYLLFFIEQLVVTCVCTGLEFVWLHGNPDLKVELQELLFHENTLFNKTIIPLLGFCLGLLIFTLLRYPYALVAFGLCIVVPSYKLLVAFSTGIIYEIPCFMWDSHRVGIVFLFLPIGFGMGIIFVGIRAIIASRKWSIEDS